MNSDTSPASAGGNVVMTRISRIAASPCSAV